MMESLQTSFLLECYPISLKQRDCGVPSPLTLDPIQDSCILFCGVGAIKQRVRLGNPEKPSEVAAKRQLTSVRLGFHPLYRKAFPLLRNPTATKAEANRGPWSPQSTMPLSPH